MNLFYGSDYILMILDDPGIINNLYYLAFSYSTSFFVCCEGVLKVFQF